MNIRVAYALLLLQLCVLAGYAQWNEANGLQPSEPHSDSIKNSSDSLENKYFQKKYDPDLQPDKEQPKYNKTRLALDKFETEIPSGILFGKFGKETSPILLKGSIIVPSGQVLEIGPGVQIYVSGDYTTITVFGQLLIKGTEREPVVIQSAKAQANPWDWDRIYCRSLNRSVFEHCIIRHANYGISIENSSVLIKNSFFEHNSIYGLYVRNSEVSIQASSFRNGHVVAIMCDAGADLFADSLVLINNITGIVCAENSMAKLTKGKITLNTNGVAVWPNSSLSIVGTDISGNITGVLSQTPIKKSMHEMVYSNGIDVKIVKAEEMNKMLKPPEEIKSLVLPKTKTTPKIKDGFVAGFSALRAPKEPDVKFIGNISSGIKYYKPQSIAHPKDIDTLSGKRAVYLQNRFPGEQSDKYYAGIQPEFQMFVSGRRGNADVNMLCDFYGNDWTLFRKNMFNLSLAYENQSLLIGDFYENISETIIYGRKITGFRFSGDYFEMGRGEKRLQFKLAGGESEMPKDAGQKEIDLVNDTVDTGMSVRQQLTYITGIAFKPTYITEIGVKGLITKDQAFKPLFRKPINDPAAPNPIQGQTGCIEAKVDLNVLKNPLTLRAELDMGVHDTIDTSQFRDIVWYNAEIVPAIDTVFSVILSGKNYAFKTGVAWTYEGYDFNLDVTTISPEYFSAGNPYLEPDRRIAQFSTKKMFSEDITARINYEYECREASRVFNMTQKKPSPIHNNTLNIASEYYWNSLSLSLTLDYMFFFGHYMKSDWQPDDSVYFKYSIEEMKNMFGVEGRQKFANSIEYSLRYELLHENDLTYHKYLDPAELNLDDGIQNRIGGKFGFKYRKLGSNTFAWQVSFKNEKRNNLKALSLKCSDRIRLDIIPRKFRLSAKADYRRKLERQNDAAADARISTLTQFYGVELEAKYMLSTLISINATGRFEKSYDETQQSADNYKVLVGGLMLTYLF